MMKNLLMTNMLLTNPLMMNPLMNLLLMNLSQMNSINEHIVDESTNDEPVRDDKPTIDVDIEFTNKRICTITMELILKQYQMDIHNCLNFESIRKFAIEIFNEDA